MEVPGGSVMGAVEAALNTAQRLAAAALQAESDEDGLSVFLDGLPADKDDGSRPGTPASSCSEGDLDGAGRKSHWKSQSIGEVGSGQRSDEEAPENVNFSQSRELWQRRAASQSQLGPVGKGGAKSFRSNQEFWELRQKHTPDLVMDLPVVGSSSPKEVGGKKSMSAASLSSLSSSSSSGEEEVPSATESIASPGGPESPDMTTAAERFAKQNQCTLKKNTKASHAVSMDAQTQTIKASAKRAKFATNDTHTSADAQITLPDTKLDDDDVCTKQMTDGVKGNQTAPGGEMVPIRSPGPQRSVQKAATKFGPVCPNPVSSFKPQVKMKPQILRKPVLPVPHPHPVQPSPEMVRKEKVHEQMN